MPVNTKYTTEAIIDALKRSNGLVYVAARMIGCTPATIYNRAKAVKSVKQAIDDSRGEVVDLAEHRLFQAVTRGDPWAISLVVKTLGKNRGYTEKTDVDITSGGRPLVKRAEEMSDDELAAIAARNRITRAGGRGTSKAS